MINLVDTATKRDLRAARLNIVLATYCVIVAGAVVTVALLVLFSHWWLANKIAAAHTEQAKYSQVDSSYGDVRSQAAAFTSDLSKVQSTLVSRSHYATALLNIAASLPTGASVSSVSFAPAFITTPLDITATTPTNAAALALKDRLSKSPIYAKVSLNNVNCTGANGTNCQISITATLNQTVFTPGATE